MVIMYRNYRLIFREILTSWSSFGKVVPAVRYTHYIKRPCSINTHGALNNIYRVNNICREKLNFLTPISSSYNIPKCSFSMSCFRGNKQTNSIADKCAESKNSDKKGQKINNEKTENILTVPNIITVFRIAATPYLGYLVLSEQFSWATGLFLVAVTLTMAGLLPVPLALTIIGRDVFLILASCIYRYKSIEAPVTLSKYFNAKNASIKFYPSNLSKLNTGVQISLVTLTLAAPVFEFVDHPLLQAMWYLTALTTISSGVDLENMFIDIIEECFCFIIKSKYMGFIYFEIALLHGNFISDGFLV
ncbi:hypothetical protein KUTeg_013295 [Tegillarca granosa]|uniref:Uncharacterized protein n=1 Tax=Tegillarca granosa TaxID=220873 RepID=A0ABQ9ETA3_TEGGR|nr:hypothetical protein KUTeg_013295 [Tegillarca granosa]